MNARDRARARWATQPVGAQRPPRRDIGFMRHPDGTLTVRIGEREYPTPVPMADRGVWHPGARKVIEPSATLKAGHPGWITIALDSRELYGPAVDEALGVPEPFVDEWEAGTRTPTEDDLRRLAFLTEFAVGWFINPNPPPELGSVFICGGTA